MSKLDSFVISTTDLLENLNLTGVRLVFHNHHLQILFFSVKKKYIRALYWMLDHILFTSDMS